MSEAVDARATKNCPFCAETILAAAIKCRHCGEMLAAGVPQATAAQDHVAVPRSTVQAAVFPGDPALGTAQADPRPTVAVSASVNTAAIFVGGSLLGFLVLATFMVGAFRKMRGSSNELGELLPKASLFALLLAGLLAAPVSPLFALVHRWGARHAVPLKAALAFVATYSVGIFLVTSWFTSGMLEADGGYLNDSSYLFWSSLLAAGGAVGATLLIAPRDESADLKEQGQQYEMQQRQEQSRQMDAARITGPDFLYQLQKLHQLHAKGVLSVAEYDARKAQQISGLQNRQLVGSPEDLLGSLTPLVESNALTTEEITQIKSIAFTHMALPSGPSVRCPRCGMPRAASDAPVLGFKQPCQRCINELQLG